VFGGAIVGETVALSIVVSVSGLATLSKLYIINGILLLGLPVLFFRNVDRFKREKLLAGQLLACAGILFLYLLVFSVREMLQPGMAQALLMVVYPISYLSKTVNFLTFWTLANDICDSAEAKRSFPVIAAWGFVGGLLGSLVAWMLLRIIDAVMLVWLWVFLYLVAWVFVKKVRNQYWDRLLRTEEVQPRKERVWTMVRDVLTIRLVRVMGLLYFLLFISVFAMDYLFWKQCHRWFQTSNTLASFQFSFYILHALATIGSLWFILPGLISQWGFVRILYSLPVVLAVGSGMLVAALAAGIDPRLFFAGMIVLQFMRYVVFENAFSPIYQMFFVAIPAARRGRAKTVLDGIVKPAAMITTGLFLANLGYADGIVLGLISVSSGGLIYLVMVVRKTYITELVPRLSAGTGTGSIAAGIDSVPDSKIVSLVQDYAASEDSDLRALAVRILAGQGTRVSLERLRELYDRERAASVREVIARSLSGFYWYDTHTLIDKLLRDSSARIRANALYSITNMNARWKWEFRDTARSLLFDSSLRVKTEAARFLWSSGDRVERSRVQELMTTLLASRNTNKRAAGLYLVGMLQPDDWELILSLNLTADAPLQVFSKSIETILRYASSEARLKAMETVDGLSRERIAAVGQAAQSVGPAVVPTLLDFLKKPRSQRMSFEVVRALRVIKYVREDARRGYEIEPRIERNILRWVVHELRSVYQDAHVWYRYQQGDEQWQRISGLVLLDSALRERVFRVAEWALDALVVLDQEGLITWGRHGLDMREYGNRLDMIEILESLGSHRIGALTVPLLKFESWERVGKVGQSLLKGLGGPADIGLGRFLTSDNRWVCLCALYAICQREGTSGCRSRLDSGEGLMRQLASDSNPYLASVVRSLNEQTGRGSSGVETFQILETVLFLKQTPLFRDVAGEKLMPLAEICEQRMYEEGTVISSEGDVSDHLFVVKSGSVGITRMVGGQRRLISVIGAGDTYGEVGLFSRGQRSATAVAHSDCCLFDIQRAALKRIVMDVPEIAYNFLEIFSEKLRSGGDPVKAPEPSSGVERSAGQKAGTATSA